MEKSNFESSMRKIHIEWTSVDWLFIPATVEAPRRRGERSTGNLPGHIAVSLELSVAELFWGTCGWPPDSVDVHAAHTGGLSYRSCNLLLLLAPTLAGSAVSLVSVSCLLPPSQVPSHIFPVLFVFMASLVAYCLPLSCVSAFLGKVWPFMAAPSLYYNLYLYFHWRENAVNYKIGQYWGATKERKNVIHWSIKPWLSYVSWFQNVKMGIKDRVTS